MPILAQSVSPLDWSIVAVFLAGVVAFGLWVSRKKAGAGPENKEFFLAGRNIPAWVAAVSLVATSLSAATFIGGPAESFKGDLTYLFFSNVAGTLGGLLAAWWLIPAAWKAGGETPYALLEQRGGRTARRAAGVTFLVGRLLASGARHMITGTAFCFLAFGELRHEQACLAIVVCGLLGTLYAAKGGVKAVIWTDLVLFITLLVAVGACFVVLWQLVPAEPARIVAAMDEGKKLKLFDFSWDFSSRYTVWATLVGVLFFTAAYGADQDLAQRMLTTKSPASAARSLVMGVLAAIPLNAVFLVLGVCLWVYYKRPDLMGVEETEAVKDGAMVFPQFIRDHLPVGIKGLLMAGLAATSLGALASAISAMAASVCTDLSREREAPPSQDIPGAAKPRFHLLRHPRVVSVLVGLALTAVALGCYGLFVADKGKSSLIDFALSVMTVAYTGLLGVFACVLLTKRGTAGSIVAALVVGAAVALVLWFVPVVPVGKEMERLAFPWVMLVGSAAAFAVCAAGKGKPGSAGVHTGPGGAGL